MQNRYTCSGIIQGRLYRGSVNAVSIKQAEYFWKRKYGFACRNFQIENIVNLEKEQGQLCFNI